MVLSLQFFLGTRDSVSVTLTVTLPVLLFVEIVIFDGMHDGGFPELLAVGWAGGFLLKLA